MAGLIRLVLCATVLVCFVNPVQNTPIFGDIWCDIFCDDDDDDSSSTTTSASTEDIFDLFDTCSGCTPRRTTRPPPLNIMIPPSPVGMNMSMQQNPSGSWILNFLPWSGGAAPATPRPAANPTTAPPTTTAAPATTTAKPTAKPANGTAAPATTTKKP